MEETTGQLGFTYSNQKQQAIVDESNADVEMQIDTQEVK